MQVIDALILGLIQGLTEFFPISSSAHLSLCKHFLHIQGDLLYFDLITHLGTLLALLISLKNQIRPLLFSPKKMAPYLLALLPLFPVYFLLKSEREALSSPSHLGYFLLFTSFLLFLASRKREETRVKKRGDVLWIGLMQAAALIPGISRSGSTISTARLLGWNLQEAALFSYLLSIPAILGGTLLETLQVIRHGTALEPFTLLVGFTASFLSGLLAVRFVFTIFAKVGLLPFALYLALLGGGALWLL
jgi:undecaprenyl-diphosphatase